MFQQNKFILRYSQAEVERKSLDVYFVVNIPKHILSVTTGLPNKMPQVQNGNVYSESRSDISSELNDKDMPDYCQINTPPWQTLDVLQVLTARSYCQNLQNLVRIAKNCKENILLFARNLSHRPHMGHIRSCTHH